MVLVLPNNFDRKWVVKIFRYFLPYLFSFLPLYLFGQDVPKKAREIEIRVQYDSLHPANQIIPDLALGAGIDGHEFGDTKKMMRPENIRAMRSAGLKSLTYRLRTELGIEAWHWNPRGHWSEKDRNQGYWVSDSIPNNPIELSYGYTLPRRGSTFDQASNTGYSRLDDGDTVSFWKSNPYLDHHFTHAPDSLHPQWLALDLGKEYELNAVLIHWAEPYALDYHLEYTDSKEIDMFKSMTILEPYLPGIWHTIPLIPKNGKGGKDTLVFQKPIRTRLVRLVMTSSSGSALKNSQDLRDSAGYAIREMYAGKLENGRFIDMVRHGKSSDSQSAMFASTTDPWHREMDKDLDTEQPGLDFIFQHQLNNGLPALFPLPLVYDNPENALSLIHYMIKRKYPVKEWELGEEPDGQYISTRDFAQLYGSLAESIRKIKAEFRIGGPSFQSIDEPFKMGPWSFTQKTWLKDFYQYLKQEGQDSLFNFFSFEWYPFDNVCLEPAPQLLKAHPRLVQALDEIMDGILPPHFPIYMTEYGYSVLGAEPEVGLEGALLNADIVGQFLTMGGTKAYLYGYEPNNLMNESGCNWGNLMLFGMDKKGKLAYPTGLFYSAQLYSGKWAYPGNIAFQVYPCTLAGRGEAYLESKVNAYALKNQGTWSIMIINKSPEDAYSTTIKILGKGAKEPIHLPSNLEIFQFGKEEYEWSAKAESGHPIRHSPPRHFYLGREKNILIPPYSITIVRNK